MKINRFSKRHLLLPPKVTLDVSKNNFVYKASLTWNSLIGKVLVSPNLDNGKQIVIPGSVTNSDLAASISYVKNCIKQLLLNSQKHGDPNVWLYTENFDLKL